MIQRKRAGMVGTLPEYAIQIVETVRQPLLVLDDKLNAVVANRALYSTFRLTGNLSGETSVFALGDGQLNIPALREGLMSVLEASVELRDFEIAHSFPELGTRTLVINASRLVDAELSHPMILVAIEDITDRRAIERALEWHSAELQRSNGELEHFAFVSSHDLQEPLRKIRAYGDLLTLEASASLGEKDRQYLARMVNAAERMQTLINDLLAFSRVGTKPPVPSVVDLNRIVADVVSDLEIAINESGASIAVGPLPTVRADKNQMRQLFQNLIGNALKFRRPGIPPVIHVAARKTSSDEVTTNTTGSDLLELSVQDNGIGFDTQYDELIFGAFQRLHSRKQYPGSGIGLAICRKIAERHGGSIVAESSPETGTNFILRIPADLPLPPRPV